MCQFTEKYWKSRGMLRQKNLRKIYLNANIQISLIFLELRSKAGTYLIKVQMDIDGYVRHMKTNFQLLELDNLIQNVYRALNGKISKPKYKSKENFPEISNWLLYTKSI